MNIGSIDLQLTGVSAHTATYTSQNGSMRLQIARVNVQRGRVIPRQIEIKVWVDSDAYDQPESSLANGNDEP
jgi:hypothetical protein